MLKTAAQYVCGNCDTFYFILIESSKEQHLFEIEILCNIYWHFFSNLNEFIVMYVISVEQQITYCMCPTQISFGTIKFILSYRLL